MSAARWDLDSGAAFRPLADANRPAIPLRRIRPPVVPLSRTFASAYQRGFDARLRGVSRYSCPYAERPGWSGAFHRAWQDGWETADQLVPVAPHVNVDDDYPEETG